MCTFFVALLATPCRLCSHIVLPVACVLSLRFFRVLLLTFDPWRGGNGVEGGGHDASLDSQQRSKKYGMVRWWPSYVGNAYVERYILIKGHFKCGFWPVFHEKRNLIPILKSKRLKLGSFILFFALSRERFGFINGSALGSLKQYTYGTHYVFFCACTCI